MTADPSALQDEVARFWSATPCGSRLSEEPQQSLRYFDEIEAVRYRHEPHIAAWIDAMRWAGKDVLEVGAGVGTDGRRISRHGARYVGINVDRGSTALAQRGFELSGTPGVLRQADVTALPFEAESFDVVYAFGVLMHVPAADRAVAEIRRVLRPGGEVRAMVYNRDSINYRFEIQLLRKAMRHLLRVPGVVRIGGWLGLPRDKLARHAQLAREQPRMSDAEWLSRNTDGPDNPYTRVYSAQQVAELLAGFESVSQRLAFFDPRHYGALSRLLPAALVRLLGQHWGWHRLVVARKPAVDRPAPSLHARPLSAATVSTPDVPGAASGKVRIPERNPR